MESSIELLKKMNEDLNLNLYEQINEMEKIYENVNPIKDINALYDILEIFIHSLTDEQKPMVIKWLKEDSLKYGVLLSMIY